MKKSAWLLATTIMALHAPASAHNLWVNGHNKAVFQADIIYGHDFPTPEAIAEERTVLFEPIQVTGQNATTTLVQSGENYHYVADKALESGTYIIHAHYKPTAWVKKGDGKWEMKKTRKDIHGEVSYCGISTMLGKRILTIGDDSGEFALKPLGKGVEITPQVLPSAIKKGALVKFKLTRDGKPLKLQTIVGSYGGYASNDRSQAFTATTDLQGVFEFRPLESGLWYLKAKVDTPSGDKDCEILNDNTTLTFDVNP